MNYSKLKNNAQLVMTLAIVIGFYSCEKEQYEEPKAATVTVTSSLTKGGDDEEEAIIQGIVNDSDSLPVAGAQVEIFYANTTNSLQTESTDGNGEFQMTVPYGEYFFEVTENGSVITTDDFRIEENSSVVITIE